MSKEPKTYTAYFHANRGDTPAKYRTGLLNGKLFCVHGHDKSHWPLSCYVFANTPDDAIDRVKMAAKEMAKAKTFDGERLKKVFPNLSWTAEEVQQDLILCAGQCWASNSGFSG